MPERKLSIGSSSTSSSVTISSDTVSEFDENLVSAIGRAIALTAQNGDLIKSPTNEYDHVFGTKIPGISISSYLRRMLKYIDGVNGGSESWMSLSCGAKALVSSLIYIDRLVIKTGLVVNSCRIHRLIAGGILIALKMNEDSHVDMSYFSNLAGISLTELKKIEGIFFEQIELGYTYFGCRF